MSAEEDQRVASLKFDNVQFEQGVKSTLASLDALNRGLKLEGATKGLSDVMDTGRRFDLSHVGQAVDDIASHFHAMSIVAITALATIAHQALIAGESVAKSLTIGPIGAGLAEYQTNINSIQTILSNTRWQHTGLEDVNKALDVLNHYSDQTIYNFTEMARNIGTFTAAGVKLDTATNAIKGIANLAAVSGSSSQQASIAMYQLSQAIASGTVKLIDWNSVVNAGMGGKVFQDALVETARVHGVAVDKMIKQNGSFRASLQEGWLSADILTETLSHFTGDMTAKQLISMGYTKQQAESIVAMGKDAQDAATKVKTIGQLLSTLQESAGSGWTKTWQLIFGDFEEARSLFTDVNDVLGGFIQRSADARNKILQDWKDLGGRTVLIEAIALAWKDLLGILNPIRLAFRDIFPKTTGEQLYKITVAIRDFFKGAMLGEETMNNLRRTFAGIFALFGIGWEIIKQVARVLFDLFQTATNGSGGILEFTANVGDFLFALHKAIQEGDGLTRFFDKLAVVLKVPIHLIQAFGIFLAALFDDFDSSKADKAVNDLSRRLTPFETVADTIAHIWDRIKHAFGEAWNSFEPMASKILSFFHDFGDATVNFLKDLGINDLVTGINTGLLAYLVLSLGRLFGHGGVISEARQVLENINDTLNTMQNTLRAATLLQIAIALGILTISVNQLSKIDGDKLAKALAGLTAMLGELVGALAIIQVMPGADIGKLYGTIGAMVALALAIKILGSAVLDLKDLDWGELARGLTGVAGLLASLALFTKFASANTTGILAGAGIILLATGIKILAGALKDMAQMSWADVGQSVTVLASSLATIAAALYFIPPTAPLAAAGVLVVALSLKLIGKALEDFTKFSWVEIAKSATILLGVLAIIGAALYFIPPTAPLAAAGVLGVALSLKMIGKALSEFSKFSWANIGKSITVLAASLTIIAVALNLMETALPGAFAVLVAAAALTVMATVLSVMGALPWDVVLKGLGSMALVFITLGIAGAALGPIVPAIIGLGAGLLLIGAGLALTGAGLFLFATGLKLLGVFGPDGTKAIVGFVAAVIGLLPVLVKQLEIALAMMIQFLIDQTPKIVELVVKLLIQLLEGIAKMAPPLTVALIKLIDLLVKVLADSVPKLITVGLLILNAFLIGIKNNIGGVVTVAVAIIVEFIKAVGRNLPSIVDAGFKLIISFLDGVTKAIDDNSEEMGAAGGRLAVAIIKGMVKGLRGGIGEVADAAKDVAKGALGKAADILGINSPSKEFKKLGRSSSEGMALGLLQFAYLVGASSEKVGTTALDSVTKTLGSLTKIIDDNMDTNPRITPILDLTQIQKDANRLGSLVNAQPLNLTTSYSTAKKVAASQSIRGGEDTVDDSSTGGTKIIFEQNNYSPKALSEADIYRNTKNQLSVAKGVVTKNDNQTGS